MAEHKDNPNKIPLEEVTCFPQWTTFSWENVTDAMRRSIGENNSKPWGKHSNVCGTTSSESSEAESENHIATLKSPKLSELGETERQLFADSAQFFKKITTPDDHPSQLVDALKVGLADILSGSGSDDNNHVSEDDFSKSLDTSFDTEKFKATQTIGTFPAPNCLVPSTGSSESDDDVSDFSTTESRESVESCHDHSIDASTKLRQDSCESNLQAYENVNITKEERPVTATPDKKTDEVSSIPDEQPNIETKNECFENSKEMLDVENEDTQMDDYDEDSFEEDVEEGEEEEDIWEKGILAEDLMEFKNYFEKEQTKLMYSNQQQASEPDSEPEDDRSDFLQSEDDLMSNKRTYADVVRAGLDPGIITYVVKPASPPLYQKQTPKESKRKSAKKSKREKRLKRSDVWRDFDQHRERRVPHGKRGSSVMPRGRITPQPYVGKGKSPVANVKSGGRNNAASPGPKMTQETTNHTKRSTRNKPEGGASRDVQGGEIHLRKKIKEEHIAKVLQEAKLTLAKLTTESLGSYEKVTCLKLQQPPIVCHNTFEVLQTQEINKAKHMKELANRLHQLTEMGVGNAEEFTEIKDILSSLHYLQTKDKYFVEPKDKKKKKAAALPLKKTKSDKSIYWFLVIAMVLIILLFIFRRQWMSFAIFSSIFIFCIQQVKKILEFFDGSDDKDGSKDKE